MKRPEISFIAGLVAVCLALSIPVGTSVAAPVIKRSTPADFLSLLEVKTETEGNSYQRSLFKHWIDADKDGCDTRVEVLQQESIKKVSCSLKGGSWVSVYDGLKTTNPSSLDIDHFVPLKEAWESGAYTWDSDTRMRFANDLEYSVSLIAVSAKSNRSKSDRDPSSWLPPSTSFTCQYIGRWIAVKYRWNLSVDPAEQKVLQDKVSSCGSKANVNEPEKASVVLGSVVSKTPSPSPSASASPSPSASASQSQTSKVLDPKFASCAEAKRNGYKRSYVKGVDPEYYYYRDGDGDGVVCE